MLEGFETVFRTCLEENIVIIPIHLFEGPLTGEGFAAYPLEWPYKAL